MAAKKKPAPPKRGASRYQPPAKKPIPGWLWMAIGLTVGAFIVFLMKLEPGRDEVKREKPEQQKAEKIAEANKTAPSPQQPVKPKYDFYTLLPESEVIVPPEAVPEKTPPVPAQPVTPVTPAEAAKIDTARAQAALLGQTPPPAPPGTPQSWRSLPARHTARSPSTGSGSRQTRRWRGSCRCLSLIHI